MLEYRIPAAGFVSAAIITVCFVIALVMINAQATGRARTLGALGVTLMVASRIVQALSGSLRAVYGVDSAVYGVGSIVAAVLVVAGLVLVALAISQARTARGRPRVLAIIGTALILLGVLARFAFQWLAESFLGRVDNATIVNILAADVVAGGVLTGAGLILLSRAVVVAGWRPDV